MADGCCYCGGIVLARQERVWGGKFGPYDPRTWFWTTRFDRHCRRAWCRALDAYWFKGAVGRKHGYRPHNTQWRGPAIYLYELAAFLGRMAEPKSARDLEYSKRFFQRRIT